MKYLISLIFISSTFMSFGQTIVRDSTLAIKVKYVNDDCPSKTIFPRKNRTYDEYVGNYAIKYGFRLADGWREDSCNGGYNRHVGNPYMEGSVPDKFRKQGDRNDFVYFYYKKGKRYSGRIIEKFDVPGSEKEIIFTSTCKNGKLQGKGTLILAETKEQIALCNFKDGELIGECVHWDFHSKIEKKVTYIKGNPYETNVTQVKLAPKK